MVKPYRIHKTLACFCIISNEKILRAYKIPGVLVKSILCDLWNITSADDRDCLPFLGRVYEYLCSCFKQAPHAPSEWLNS